MSLIDNLFGFFSGGKKSGDQGQSFVPRPNASPEMGKGKDHIPTLRERIRNGEVPEGLEFRNISLTGEKKAFVLPAGLRCFSLDLSKSAATSLPAGLGVEFKIDLTDCRQIRTLPSGIKTGSLVLAGSGVEELPERMDVNFLNVDRCANLVRWPESARVSVGSVRARNCVNLEKLPDSLRSLTNLDLSGCSKIGSLPDGLQLAGWLDIGGTAIQGLPESLKNVPLRWRGVQINARIAFFPETLSAAEILGESNAEVRRVMLERRGLDNFFDDVQAAVLDEDQDAGGKRRLLKVALPGDEDLVCVSLSCPSTGRKYVIRVPPAMKTCHQAVAWMAGFDNPADYRPIVET